MGREEGEGGSRFVKCPAINSICLCTLSTSSSLEASIHYAQNVEINQQRGTPIGLQKYQCRGKYGTRLELNAHHLSTQDRYVFWVSYCSAYDCTFNTGALAHGTAPRAITPLSLGYNRPDQSNRSAHAIIIRLDELR